MIIQLDARAIDFHVMSGIFDALTQYAKNNFYYWIFRVSQFDIENHLNVTLIANRLIDLCLMLKLLRICSLDGFSYSQYPFKKNESIINYFNNFDDFLHEEAMWQISEAIKPRPKK